MPAWGNTDNHNQKPKFPRERETREVVQLTVLTGNTAGNNVIQVSYNDGAQNNVANIGVQAGQFVYFYANGFGVSGGLAGNGTPGFFQSNTSVSSTSGNTITLTNNLFNTISTGFGVEFDKAIVYNTNKTASANYNSDTILVTTSRLANTSGTSGGGGSNVSNTQLGNVNVGWNRIVRKINNDGTVRFLKETLVALANPTAANVSSANTSSNSVFGGV